MHSNPFSQKLQSISEENRWVFCGKITKSEKSVSQCLCKKQYNDRLPLKVGTVTRGWRPDPTSTWRWRCGVRWSSLTGTGTSSWTSRPWRSDSESPTPSDLLQVIDRLNTLAPRSSPPPSPVLIWQRQFSSHICRQTPTSGCLHGNRFILIIP